MTTKTTSNISGSTNNTNTTNNDGAKPRTKPRKPPVAERLTFAATAAAPPTAAPPTTAPPPTAPPPAGAPAPIAAGNATPAPSASASPQGAGGGSTSSAADVAVGAPPIVTLPPVPNGFVPVTPAELRGYRALQSEVAAAPDAIAELQAFTDYTALFGITAPPIDQLVQRLTIASEWTLVLSQSSAWYKYAKSEYGVAWKDALELVEKLKMPFQLATTANPALVSKYPSLTRLLGASKAASKRAVATRAKNKKQKAASAQAGAGAAAAGTPSAQAPAAGTPATPASAAEAGSGASAPPAPAPTRVVTVQG